MASKVELLTGGPLLNFYTRAFIMPHPITAEYIEWVSVEHYFQACKGIYLRPNQPGTHAAFRAVEAVRKATRPADAKRLGRQLPIWLALWNKAALGHMLAAHIGKFAQHKDLARMLVATDMAKLIEHRPDPIWGDNMDGTGKNLCGRSLMLVREMAKDWDLNDEPA